MLALLAEIVWNKDTLGIVMGCAIPIVGVVAVMWTVIETTKSNNALTKSNNALKSDMVRQGMSAEEIERVLSAKGAKKSEDE